VSEEPRDRGFERWALAGACVLAAAGIVAFQARKDPPVVTEDERRGDQAADLLHVRIGGERPPAPAPDERGDGLRVAPDPAPPGPAPGPVEPPPQEPRTVVVQPGETLGQIAERELGTVRRLGEIVELNGIEDPDDVQAGTELRLPPR
jgi:nucleoid-associated protein YgaU